MPPGSIRAREGVRIVLRNFYVALQTTIFRALDR